MRQPVLYALYCLAAAIEGSLLLINMISFLMKRNILTSDPAVPTFRYTFFWTSSAFVYCFFSQSRQVLF